MQTLRTERVGVTYVCLISYLKIFEENDSLGDQAKHG